MNHKPFVVAIAGGTCSGKSTLTERLGEHFPENTRIFNMDKYFKKEPPTTVAPITRKVYVEHNSPDTLELDRLFADFDAALRDESLDLILIEGLFALYLDKIREAADLKIFVDLRPDARLVRRIKKHMAWGQTYEQVTERYMDTVSFRHDELVEPTRWHADMVINGNLDANSGVLIAKNYIEGKIK